MPLLLLNVILALLSRPAIALSMTSPRCHGTTVAPLQRFGKAVPRRRHSSLSMIGTGFSFDDGQQLLVSVQKPLGLILEQDDDDDTTNNMIVVADLDPTGSAARAGVQVGDVLVAVQNVNMNGQTLEYALQVLAKAPQVVNVRFVRP